MGATQITLIVLILVLVIVYPILVSSKNKRENQKVIEQTNSLKRGDKVLTTSGVYGTIVDLKLENEKKIVTIETGSDKNKGYISVDAYAIYTVFSDEKQVETTDVKKAEVKEEKTSKKDKKVENIEVVSETATVEEKPADELLASNSSTVEDVEAQVSGKKSRKKKGE